jgi:putative transposase
MINNSGCAPPLTRKNELPDVRLFPTTTALTEIFRHELRQKHDVETTEFLVDRVLHFQTTLHRAGLRFQIERHENWNVIERIFREVKRCPSSFSNRFSHVVLETTVFWLQSFARWRNAPN